METGHEDAEDESKLDHVKSYILAWISMFLYSFAHIILAQLGNEKGVKSIYPQSIAMIMIGVT